MLDAMLREHAGLASFVVHCRHCSIRFLTHPRNANRRDLHCPFGCREHRRRQLANERSKKHYQRDEGRRNKKLLNAKRSAAGSGEQSRPDAAPSGMASVGSQDASRGSMAAARADSTPTSPDRSLLSTHTDLEEASDADVKLALDGFTLDAATLVTSRMLPYLTMVACLIEGRAIRREELLRALLRSMRQRSFDRLPRREYVLRFLDQHPP